MTEMDKQQSDGQNKFYPAPKGQNPLDSNQGKSSILKLIMMIVALLAILFLAGIYLWKSLLAPVGLDPNPVTVSIPKGASTNQIGQILWGKGLIKSKLALKIYSRVKGYDNKMQAGEYLVAPSMSTPDILTSMVTGSVADISFTVPEGYTTSQIADLLTAKGYVKRDQFMDQVANGNFSYSFLQGLPHDERRLEGYLFPNTYSLGISSNEQEIIKTMLNEFQKQLPGDFEAKARSLGLSVHEAVTIASLIEREAKKPEEQPLVSAVIQNRLKKRMRLEIDATVQYLFPKPKPRLYFKDLKIQSPYNTYRNFGLPPGPIACPGRTALQAAVNPAPVGYLYYVVKGDGTHAFATTFKEHLANKQKYLSKK